MQMNRHLAQSLIKKYGSPLYVYDEGIIEYKAKCLLQAAQGFHVSYAMKANNNKQILKILKKSGISSVDVVSPGEVYKALQNGYAPQEILYTENFISEEQIDYALSTGVILNIGAFQTLYNFREKLSGHKIFIRVNPDLGAGQNYNVITGGPHSKFGIYSNELEQVRKIAQQNNIKIIGLHQHIGSNLKKKDKQVFLQTTESLFKTTQIFQQAVNINIGGGIGIKYRQEEELLMIKELYDEVRNLRDKYSAIYNRELKIWIEPGRFLVGDSGVLLCKITAKKRTPQKIFYGTDTGFNHLLRPALYGSHHEIKNLYEHEDMQSERSVICGNICECTDNLGKDIAIAGKIGDILCIQNAGAYGFSMSSNYNQRCKPAEVLIQGNQDKIIRRRQTFQDLIQKL